MELEEERSIECKSTILSQQIAESVRYMKAIYSQREKIENYLTDLMSDNQMLSIETRQQLKIQLKWLKAFFNNYSDGDDSVQDHMDLKNNIFNQFQNYLQDMRCSFYTIFTNDLKHLPDFQSSSQISEGVESKFGRQSNDNFQNYSYDSLKFTIALSYLILYAYYFFINKHKNIYLTNSMFTTKQKLIDIASISHIDYIMCIYENDSLIEEGENVEDSFKLEVKDFECEIEQFENFLDTVKFLSQLDEDLIKYIPKIENLYGFFLAKQQTIQICKENNKKMALLESFYKDVVEMTLVSMSIPNNKLIENKKFNMFYHHPYISLNHLTFNEFITPTKATQANIEANTPFYDSLYQVIFSSFNKLFQNNCFISKDTTKSSNTNNSSSNHSSSNKQSSSSTKHSHDKRDKDKDKKHHKSSHSEQSQSQSRLQRVELQKCLNLIQETIIVTEKSDQLFSKLSEQITQNIS